MPTATGRFRFAEQVRSPALALVFAIQLVLGLALYAQFNAGLPALVLTGLHASTHTFGLAVAINACLVAALTAPVAAMTRKHTAGRLLASTSTIWLAGWLILALPLWTHLPTAGTVIVGLIVLAIRETTTGRLVRRRRSDSRGDSHHEHNPHQRNHRRPADRWRRVRHHRPHRFRTGPASAVRTALLLAAEPERSGPAATNIRHRSSREPEPATEVSHRDC